MNRYNFIITLPALICMFVCFSFKLQAQVHPADYNAALKLLKLKEYYVPVAKNDTIYFLSTIPDKKKKTIVFCQGSGPVPLVINPKEGLCGIFPFRVDSTIRKEFNIVIISKPGLKRYVTDADLSAELMKQGQYLQLDSMNRPPQKYTDNNKLYILGGNCIKVIQFLKKQPWVDKDNIYIFGHSQGAIVAAYVAANDPQDIKKVVYSQGNAYGVYAGYLSAMMYNQQSMPDVTRKMDSVYHIHTSLIDGKPDKEMAQLYQWKENDLSDKKNNDFYDLYYGGWRSLEEPTAIEYLLKIKCPVLLVQGLNSPSDLDNKNIPLDFARHHKHNLTTLFYPGYDHNFFKQITDEKGNPKEPEFHWDDVFGDVRKWLLHLR
jgi:dienelactone hydrolase